MDFETVVNLDYESQHFEFHPRTFVDTVYNAFYEPLFEGLNALNVYLCDQYNHVIPADDIRSNTDILFKDLVKILDKAIDKFETYIDENIFMIPNHVLLPEDEVHHTHPCTKDEDEKLDEEIEQIKQRILEERLRKSVLKSKIEEQKYVKEDLVTFKSKLQQLLSIVQGCKNTKEDLELTMIRCLQNLNGIKGVHQSSKKSSELE
ncbi:protein MIS12 homolog [Caerostris darwini]|uniref:Protein MIS12 homolog n=1 Tax=Caerostris darwini TaxID=1538125 RepID=A0AAV4U463_9ARAC|nr:protein MIS12 homolog [Caerostris darwini]